MPDPIQNSPATPAPEADEFAGIRPARRRPSVLGLGVVLLSAFLIFHQRADVVYALTSGVPRVLGDAGALLKSGAQLPENRYVRVSGTPDFESALVLDTQGEWKFRTFFRLLETDRKIFVQRAAGPLPLDMAQNDSFAGRLVRLRSVSFSDAIRDYFSKHVTSTHVFDPAIVRRAMEDKRLPGIVADKLGESVAIAGNEPLTFDVRVPLRYHVDIPREIFEKLATATKALKRTGATVLGVGKPVAREANLSGFAFECLFPRERESEVLSAVADLASRTRIEPVIEQVIAPLSQLQMSDAGLRLHNKATNENKQVAWNDVAMVRTASNLAIAEDAYLLLEGERPSAYYKAVVATAILLVFALVNLLALRRRS